MTPPDPEGHGDDDDESGPEDVADVDAYADPVELPMFPLGSVLLPGMALPLQVFEPRYRVLVDTVLLADRPEFGVVLIERGSEVGGGDTRATVGCIARVLELTRQPDGGSSLLSVGTRRIEILDWLPDDPFPRAMVRALDDAPLSDEIGSVEALDRLETDVRRVLSLMAELAGVELDEEPVFSDDPDLRLHQLAIVSPLGPLDRLKVLRASGREDRIALLQELVAEQEILLEARRSFGLDPDEG